MTEDWEIRTGDGGMRLELPDAFGASLDASTGDGRVRLEGIETERPTSDGESEAARRSLKQQLGSGGRQLRVRSAERIDHDPAAVEQWLTVHG